MSDSTSKASLTEQAVKPFNEETPEEILVSDLVESIRDEWDEMRPGVDTCYTFEGQLGLEILRARRRIASLENQEIHEGAQPLATAEDFERVPVKVLRKAHAEQWNYARDLEQQLARQMAANENMVREKDQLSVELADTKTKLEAALDHIRCEESISPTLPGVAELQAEVELGRRRHSEYRDEAEGEFIRYESKLATLKAALQRVPVLLFHQNAKWDSDEHRMIHIPNCPGCALKVAIEQLISGGTK